MKQVLLLLQSQEDNIHKNPETWTYWQQRAGNEIANQLYKEGDYVDALQIYLNLLRTGQVPRLANARLVSNRPCLRTAPAMAKSHRQCTDRITDCPSELTEATSTPKP